MRAWLWGLAAAVLLLAAAPAAAAPVWDEAVFAAIAAGDYARLAATVTAGNADAADGYGKTPLLLAIQQRQTRMAELLLARGADVNAANANGITPAIAAVQMRLNGLLGALLARGADANAADAMGMTALHWAALMNRPAVEPLLTARANPLAVSAQGLTVREQAARAGAPAETLALLAAAEERFAGRPATTGATDYGAAAETRVAAAAEPARVISGPAAAPVTVVAYVDFECPYSRFAMGQLATAMAAFPGKVRLVVKSNPLGFHARAYPAAVAFELAWAGGREQAWLFCRETMAGARRLPTELPPHAADVDERIYADMDEARGLFATGTPAFVIDGEPVLGARQAAFFRARFAAALE